MRERNLSLHGFDFLDFLFAFRYFLRFCSPWRTCEPISEDSGSNSNCFKAQVLLPGPPKLLNDVLALDAWRKTILSR